MKTMKPFRTLLLLSILISSAALTGCQDESLHVQPTAEITVPDQDEAATATEGGEGNVVIRE